MNITIGNANELPQLLAELKRQHFYGQLHLTFRDGNLSRLVTEHSQILDDGATRDDYRKQRY
jgi:hypothetical protein